MSSSLKVRKGVPHSFGWVRLETYPNGASVWETPCGKRMAIAAGVVNIEMAFMPSIHKPWAHKTLIAQWKNCARVGAPGWR